MVITATGVLGLLIGSFLNVVVHRVPQRQSIVRPRSTCGSCGTEIRAIDNIPIVSWLLLRGACHHCGARISLRYPLVELGTALAFAGVAWWLITTFPTTDAASIVGVGAALIAFLYLAAIGIALALIDLETHTLPNRIVLPAYLVGGALLVAAALLLGEPGRIGVAAAGGGILFIAYFVMAWIRPGGMGMGDVKLAGVLGMYLGWLGWGQLAVGAFAAFLLGGFFAIGLLIAGRAKKGSGIPFGPWMIAGAWVGALAGAPITEWYLVLTGLR